MRRWQARTGPSGTLGSSLLHPGVLWPRCRRFVDPNDPTKVFLTSPVPSSQQLKTTPQYAPNFQETQHERYEDMGLRP